MGSSSRLDTLPSAAGYLICVALIPVYVNMFTLWKTLSIVLGKGFMTVVPICLVLGLGILVAYRLRRHTVGRQWQSLPLLCGFGLCLLGLAIPDPSFPVKRIHVTEYLLLAGVARHAMSARLDGLPLLIFSTLFALLLGIHDEMLQGLHPARTYGLRDMAVNALGAAGGGLIFHGLGWFSGTRSERQRETAALGWPSRGYLVSLILAVAMYAVPLTWYKGTSLPFWPALPLAATAVIYSLYGNAVPNPLRHGLTAISLAASSLTLYPFIAHVSPLTFY